MNHSAAAELARRIMHLDGLARLHVSPDITTRARHWEDGAVTYTISRPCGVGTQTVARGDYDEVILQLTGSGGSATARSTAPKGES